MTHTAAIIGAGPAGLMTAEILANAGISVVVYDRMPTVARKFLMAGRGGLNLTHSEDLSTFLTRYGKSEHHLSFIIKAFTPQMLRDWCEGLGQKTFVGTSGRVFPVGLKASPLLRAWLRRLDTLSVKFSMKHEWKGWDDKGQLVFHSPDPSYVKADVTILALGGASWPRLGSDGGWAKILENKGISVASFQPSNCGFNAAWSNIFRTKFAGKPLKSVVLSFNNQTVPGEAMLTENGIEGGAIYALSGYLREAINSHGHALIHIDLKPDVSVQDLTEKLTDGRGSQSLPNYLRKAIGLLPAAIGLIQEILHSGIQADTPEKLAMLIKAVPLRLTGPAGIERAISSAGGIKWDALDSNLMLKTMPGVFAAGEMLDWEAPTGGYLLQASYSTAVCSANGAIDWLRQKT